jgi:hypothetical protein
MPRPLDETLKKVAHLRQVSIKTARDWRDSSNNKWFLALEELNAEDAVIDLPDLDFKEAEMRGLDKAGQDLIALFPLEELSM